MNTETFNEWIGEHIPCALFHVEPTDKCDETGAALEEKILVDILSKNPELLAHKPLKWFMDYFLPHEEEPTGVSHPVNNINFHDALFGVSNALASTVYGEMDISLESKLNSEGLGLDSMESLK